MARRLLATCLALGLTLLYTRAADARPMLEVSTSIGGADSSEYLVRVANPDASETSGVLELRRSDDRVVTRGGFVVPGHSTRYFRLPGDRAARLGAVAVTSEGTFRAQERFTGNPGAIVFDIPADDAERLQEFRVHQDNNVFVTHASFDDATHAPVLTRRAAVYDGVSLVLIPAHVLAALPTAERDALTTWVRAGGEVAMSVNEKSDLARLSDLVGENGARLQASEFGSSAALGLGHIDVLSFDPWSAEANGDLAAQEKISKLVAARPAMNHFFGEPWNDKPPASLDPNEGYRSVIALAGVLLVVQAIVTAFVFRRLAVRRGMGPAYRFAVGSSAVTFAAVIGLGIYAKGGFGARVGEVTFADAASGETVAWVERRRTYFASDTRSVAVTPRDPANDLIIADDAHALTRVDDARVVVDSVEVHPWQTTVVTERGTTKLAGGVTLDSAGGKIVVHNASGSVLRNVIVASNGVCFSFGDIDGGAEKTSGTPQSCTKLGPAWVDYGDRDRLDRYVTPHRLTLFGQIEEERTPIDGFRMQRRTTVLRVTGDAS